MFFFFFLRLPLSFRSTRVEWTEKITEERENHSSLFSWGRINSTNLAPPRSLYTSNGPCVAGSVAVRCYCGRPVVNNNNNNKNGIDVGPTILTVVRVQRDRARYWLSAPNTNAVIVYHQDLDVSSVCVSKGGTVFRIDCSNRHGCLSCTRDVRNDYSQMAG